MSQWGPLERRAYLDALDGKGEPAIFSRIAEAEQLVALAEADWNESVGQLRLAAADAPARAVDRELTPASRHQLVELYQAQEREARVAGAYFRARQRLDQLLAVLDDLSRPDLGRSPAGSRT